ncbi:hypothetical protein D3C75_921500 [compost metagenome]
MLLLDIPDENFGFLLAWCGAQSAPDGRRSKNFSVHISGTEHTLILDYVAVNFGFPCRCIMDRKRPSQRTVTGNGRNKQFTLPFRHMHKPFLIISEYCEPLRVRAPRLLIQIINIQAAFRVDPHINFVSNRVDTVCLTYAERFCRHGL